MLVYGQPEFSANLSILLNELRNHCVANPPACLDELRTLLIQTGQVEQAVDDCDEAQFPGLHSTAVRIRQLTDKVARMFVSAWLGLCQNITEIEKTELQDFLRTLSLIDAATDPCLTVKIPEGYEFYTLFPEQYCLAALGWVKRHEDAANSRVTVVGIRSIGTSLSAVVAALLRTQGWHAERFTVRPRGHPFARTVELNPSIPRNQFALIVDEGPGLSGSSMAATACELARFAFREIAFLPGHSGDPGTAASEETRKTWARIPRFVRSLPELRWEGRSLPESLLDQTETLSRNSSFKQQSEDTQGQFSGLTQVEDLSAGLWRRHVFSDEIQWPTVATRFERTKFLCRSKEGFRVLWKFAGLGCMWQPGMTASGLESMRQTTPDFTEPSLKTFRGFISFSWLEGARLNASDLSEPKVLAQVARYLVLSRGSPLTHAESNAAIDRLENILAINLQEAFGDCPAAAHIAADYARTGSPTPSYSDGRMAPHEWVRLASGHILKTDHTGNVLDHTLVGRQSLLWDVAGVLVEWNLNQPTADLILRQIRDSGISFDWQTLFFYQIAYSAFRMGLCAFCAGQAGEDWQDSLRLSKAADFYRSNVKELLTRRKAIAPRRPCSRVGLGHPNY